MEESKSWSEWTGKRSAETAETLRKLRVQADESLNARRRHLSDLETEINHQIQQVASDLANELVETCNSDESDSQQKLLAQIDQLTSQTEQEAHQLDRLNQELSGLKQERMDFDQKQTHLQQEFQDVRVERDALAARVAELEEAPPLALDAEQVEEIADLRQRFEMAVDDVRQLKQEKSQLQTELQKQLATLPTGPVTPVSDGPLDWQAQKALMLASLAEEEEVPISEQRQQERTTIEGTLSVTDQVVTEKDHVIAELREQLATIQSEKFQGNQQSDKSLQTEQQAEEASRNALLTDDELIQQERARLENLQQEWKDKLRQAELDISIERATLARERAALEEKLVAVKELSPKDQKATDQRPRRRWMAALGIKSDDEVDE